MHEKSRMANALRLLAALSGLSIPTSVFCRGKWILTGRWWNVKHSLAAAPAGSHTENMPRLVGFFMGKAEMQALKRIATWALIAAFAVAAFLWWQDNLKKERREKAAKEQAREERIKHLLATTKAETRVFEAQQGQLVVVTVPLPSDLGGLGSWVEKKRCFVWRDNETKTSALSCEDDSLPMEE